MGCGDKDIGISKFEFVARSMVPSVYNQNDYEGLWRFIKGLLKVYWRFIEGFF